MLAGIDISSYQDAATLASWLPHAQFVVVKASQGIRIRDSSHTAHTATARAAGKLLGHYHYAEPARNGPTVEADYFTAAAAARPGEVLVLDFEPYGPAGAGYTCPAAGWPAWILSFAARVEDTTGALPWLYANHDVLQQLLTAASTSQAADLHRLPLWVADYAPPVVTLHGWASWTAHQWIDQPVDQDYFAGGIATWARLAIPTTPAIGDPMTDPTAALATLGWPTDTEGVRQFQRAYHFIRDAYLTVDGIIGPKTTAAIANSLARHKAGKGDISANFSAREFACRCGGKLPGCRRVKLTWELLHGLERLRAAMDTKQGSGFAGLSIVSGYRCEAYNASIPGSASRSQHMSGTAADVPGVLTLAEVESLRWFRGIGYGAQGGKVTHVDVRPGSGSSPATWSYAGW